MYNIAIVKLWSYQGSIETKEDLAIPTPLGPCIWSSYLIGDIDKIHSVQQCFTRKVTGMSHLAYKDRLNLLKLEYIETNRLKADLMLYYKVLHGLIDTNIENCIKTYNSHRGDTLHLFQFFCRTEVRKNFSTNRIVTHWNNLKWLCC